MRTKRQGKSQQTPFEFRCVTVRVFAGISLPGASYRQALRFLHTGEIMPANKFIPIFAAAFMLVAGSEKTPAAAAAPLEGGVSPAHSRDQRHAGR
ncbi:MAG: hypothetical protein WCJ07_02450 [Verrucomicrobiota bacterium]